MTPPSPRLLLAALGCAACQPPPDPRWAVGATTPIESKETVQHVFGADLDGDGTDELGTVTGSTAHIAGQSVALPGAFQRALAVPQGSGEVVWLATGQGRTNREAPITVTEISADGARPIFERQGDRDQLTDLRHTDGKVWAALYADSKRVSGGWLSEGGFEPITREHMAQKQLPLADGSVVVGRVYGTAPKSPGDLRRIPKDGKTVPLQSLRGVRALATADLDGDGHEDLISGDGWHFAYGKEGDARVVVHRGPDFTETRVVGWVPGSYAALHIEPVGSGKDTALVVQGSHRVVLLARDDLGWGVLDLGPVSEIGTIAVLDPETTTPRVAISDPEPRVVQLVLEAQ